LLGKHGPIPDSYRNSYSDTDRYSFGFANSQCYSHADS
jgi:hypothetical protein